MSTPTSALTRVATQSTDLAARNLIHVRRSPGLLVSSLVEPVVYALLIGYVFGNSLGGGSYRSYLVAGLIAQTAAFTTTSTTVGLARDLEDGMVDRFRSLPMSRVALLLGRTLSDLATSAVSIAVTTLCGVLMGWRPHTGPAHVAAGFALVLFFSYAMSWIGVFVGLVAPDVQVAAGLGLIWLFPATFVSAGFVSGATLPGPLATVAAWNPITSVANALRRLFGNTPPPGFALQHDWPAAHPVLYTLACSLLTIAVFTTLSTWRYHARTSR
ncbi:ABC transporter permease [Streptomyces acidiscabies]|uniref:Transport permease protein n=1 Tax=Streptomyces acidiscabies TaxID=42234 RepID=A0A0L0JQN9_9ACTN|nr:ABC transporter permease [Streptomyces acidiscabies]KND28052.1 ABC transporter [Streptomyces acidiscabies]